MNMMNLRGSLDIAKRAVDRCLMLRFRWGPLPAHYLPFQRNLLERRQHFRSQGRNRVGYRASFIRGRADFVSRS